MKRTIRTGLAAAAALALSAWLVPAAAGADPGFGGGPGGFGPPGGFGGPGAHDAVFVQTDATAGNAVVAYDRAPDGTLTLAGTYPTGGLGGRLDGAVVDDLASQGSLAFDPDHDQLYAVNAGSNTVSVFDVAGSRLALTQVIASGGTFPVSVAVDGAFVYVLNALNGADVSGFWSVGGRLVPIPGSTRALGLDIPDDADQFTSTPGQVAFTPDGRHLLVTTKNGSNTIDVFAVGFGGWLSATPVENVEAGTVPFALTFDAAGRPVVADAGTDAVTTYTLAPNGTLTAVDTADTGQQATCWISRAQGYLFASNAGSADLSALSETAGGDLTVVGAPTATDGGTVDSAATPDGRFLYVQTGASGIVDEFQVAPNGTLTSLGSVTVAGSAGGEGIVAS